MKYLAQFGLIFTALVALILGLSIWQVQNQVHHLSEQLSAIQMQIDTKPPLRKGDKK